LNSQSRCIANTAANNLQTHHPLVQDHRSWQAECMAGWQTGLLVLVQSVLQHMHVLLLANTAAVWYVMST